MTPEDFTETIGLCQFLPGPNVGNASIVLGKRWFGIAGSLVAFLGLFALPFVWVLTLFAFYADFAASTRCCARWSPASARPAPACSSAPRSSSAGRSPATRSCWRSSRRASCVAVLRISLVVVLPVALGISLLLARRGRI